MTHKTVKAHTLKTKPRGGRQKSALRLELESLKLKPGEAAVFSSLDITPAGFRSMVYLVFGAGKVRVRELVDGSMSVEFV